MLPSLRLYPRDTERVWGCPSLERRSWAEAGAACQYPAGPRAAHGERVRSPWPVLRPGSPDPGGCPEVGSQGWAVTGAAFQTPLVRARGTAPSPLGSGHWICPLLAPPGPLPAFAPRVPMGTCSVPGWARGVPTGSLSGNEAFCTVGLLDADLRREGPSISGTLWVCAPWPSCRTRDEAVQTNQLQAH